MFESSHRGLIVCENAADEKAVTAALKQFDPRLRLGCEVDREHKRPVYVVVRVWSDSHDAAFICDWRDDNQVPLPLSHRLVDKVKDLRAGSRAPLPDAVAHNDALTAAARQEFEEATEDMLRDAVDRRGRLPVFHRSPGLARTRARLRDQGLDS